MKLKLTLFLVAPTFFVLLITTSVQFQINRNAVDSVSRRSTEQALRAIAKIIESATDPIDEIRSFNSGSDTIGYLVDLQKRNSPCRRSKFTEECQTHLRALKSTHGNRIKLLAQSNAYDYYKIDGKRFNFIITKTSIPNLYGLMAVEGNDFGPETDELVNLIFTSKAIILLICTLMIAVSTNIITRPLIKLVSQVANLQDENYEPLELGAFQPQEIIILNGAVNQAHADLTNAIAAEKARSKQVEDYQRSLRHDLKSATLGAYNMIDLLELYLDDADEDVQEAVYNAKESSHNAYKLVHFTSNLEQFENMEFDWVKPSEVRDLLLPSFVKENVTWNVPDSPEINISLHHFSRAVSNLVSNAIKFSAPGSLVKVVFYSNSDHFIFSVEDQGIGIPEHKISAIFEMGLQSRLRPEIEGTGMGLHSVKRCIEKHGGSVRVKSQEGEGSVFLLVCPHVEAITSP